ncbi:hypothetical protein Tco_0262256 [Tanacetum coccineum]
MTEAKFDIEKFDGTDDFGLWRIKMRALLIQHGCEAALEVLPADMEYQTKVELNKKAHSAVILCIGNKVPREVTEETTTAGVWSKLETLYMTKSLANKLYLKNKLYTFYIPAGRKISEHIDEINKIVLDLANIEDVMAILNSKEIKERSKAKGDDGEGLYVRRRTDRRDSRQNFSKNNRKKSTGYAKKDEQPSFSGSTYDDFKVMMVMSAQTQALLDWIIDSGCSYHMTPKLDILFDFLECDGGSLQLGDNRECKIRGIGKVSLMLVLKKKTVLHRFGIKDWYRLYMLDDELPKIVTSRNVVFNESVMYKDTLKNSGAGDKSVEELQVEVELQRLNNHTLKVDQTDQEDGDDKDAGDQETDQPPNLTDYLLVRDREPRTRTKPLRFRDESNMAAYAFVAAEEEDTHE